MRVMLNISSTYMPHLINKLRHRYQMLLKILVRAVMAIE